MENPEKLVKFRKVNEAGNEDLDLDIPALPQDRTVTDKKGFFLYGLVLLLYFSLWVYYITHEPTKLTGHVERSERSAFDENSAMPWQYFPKFVAIIVITSGLCTMVLYLLVCVPTAVMWTIIYNPTVIFGILAYLAWSSFLPYDHPDWDIRQNPKLLIPIFLTSFAVMSIFLSCIFHKTVKPLASLYQEGAKVLFAMPTLLTPAILITAVQGTISAVAVMIGVPVVIAIVENHTYLTIPLLLLILTTTILLWNMQMVAGFQCMMTAGSVSSWYFTTFQLYLESSILRSISNTAKFHAGTVMFGTFLHPFVSIVKCLTLCFTKWCKVTACLEGYSMKNGLVVTALHGQPFLESVKRARNLLDHNLLIGLKFSSDFIVRLIRLHLLVYSTVIAFAFFVDSNNIYIPMAICTTLNFIVIFVFYETFEATIYTLLICYCEDRCVTNNNPSLYSFMTTNLNDVFNNIKQDRYKNNLILAQRTIVNGNNYTQFV